MVDDPQGVQKDLAVVPELVPSELILGKVLGQRIDAPAISITEDRAARVFYEWQDNVKNKSAWHTPLAFVVSIALTLVTADFHDLPFLKALTVKGIFIASAAFCVVWLVRDYLKANKITKSSADDFVAHLKAGTKQASISQPGDKQTKTAAQTKP